MSDVMNDQERKTLGILAALAMLVVVVCLFRMASCQEHQDKVFAEMRSKQVEAMKESKP